MSDESRRVLLEQALSAIDDLQARLDASERSKHEAIAIVGATEQAGIDVGDVVARRAIGDALFDIAHGLDEAVGLLAGRSQNVEGEALGAFRADAGKPLQLLYQSREWIGQQHAKAQGS